MKKIIIAASILATFVMSGCRPETRNQMLGIPDNAILLSTENFSDVNAKTSVSGTSVQWVSGDQIDFYVGTGSKQTRDVVVSEGNAYIASALTGDGVIRGYYPAGICGSGATSNTPSIKYPSEYPCSVSGGGLQVIALPMVGKASAGAGTIRFMHVSAAVNVMLRNSVGVNIYVDKVEVISDVYALNSRFGAAVNINGDVPVCTGSPYESGTESDRIVTVTFSTPFEVPVGSNDKSIQVPIRPIGSDSLTINVYCHSASKSYIYSYKPDDAVPALGRNVMVTAMVDLNTAGHMREIAFRKIDLNSVSSPFSAQDGDTLYGIPKDNLVINIEDDATINLNGINATGKNLSIRALGNATINLLGTNTITGGSNYAGIHGKSGKTLTIQGGGSLYDSVSAYGTAAIGSCYTNNPCGDIVIKGGNITAIASYAASAIGCGTSYACGNITIEGGTVIAKSTYNGAAAIGTSASNSASCGNITIKNTVTSVTATKGSDAQHSIGKGSSSSTCGTVTIGGNTGYIEDSPYTYTPSSSK